jgi:Na+/H+-dicarboxylate symporter
MIRQHSLLRPPRQIEQLAGMLTGLVKGRLWAKVLAGMFLGILVGMALGPSAGLVEPATGQLLGAWLALPGRLFLALIQMIVVPLVFASIVGGLAGSDDLDQLRRVGIAAGVFFVLTTVVAVVIGIGLMLLLQPGTLIDAAAITAAAAEPVPQVTPPTVTELPELLVGVLPQNPLGAMVEREMLHVVLFALITGIALLMMAPDRARPLIDLLASLQEVCMTVVRWAMRLAPIAVFGLMAELTARTGLDALVGMAAYVGTVLLGLMLLLGLYLVLVRTLAGRRPGAFMRQAREVQLLAFSTSSSAAVMPLSMRTAEEQMGVRPSVARLVVPLGATVSMTGTALYQGAAAVFLAQVFGVDIGIGGLVLVVVTTVGASIGSPATPGVGIVILAMVLSSIGVPAAGVALILGVDRILDMTRTAVNVTGDLVACAVLDARLPAEAAGEAEPAPGPAAEAASG